MLWRMENEVTAYTGVTCKEITPASVRFDDADGSAKEIPADLVIVSAGMRPLTDAAEAFRDAAPYYRPIGDCTAAKNVRIATQTAFDAVRGL